MPVKPRTLLVLACLATWLGSVGFSAVRGAAQESFDRLSPADRKAFGQRFAKEIYPLMQRNGKDGCVGCHSGKLVTALKLSGKAEADFAMLVKEGFFLPDDAGSILGRITDKSKDRRMPLDRPPWTDKDVELLRRFVDDLAKKNPPGDRSHKRRAHSPWSNSLRAAFSSIGL